MGEKRTFQDAFAPRKPQGRDGFGRAKDAPAAPAAVSRAKPPVADAFKPAPKPMKAAKPAKPEKPKDAFAPKAKAAQPKPVLASAATKPAPAKPGAMAKPPPQKPPPRPDVALKPVQPPGARPLPMARAPDLKHKPAKPAPLAAAPFAPKQPAMARAEPVPRPRNLFGRSGAEPKARQPSLTPAPRQKIPALTPAPKQRIPAMAFAAAGATLPRPHGNGGVYNPFDRKRFVKSPAPAAPVEHIAAPPPRPAPDPFFDLPPEQAVPPPEPVAPSTRRAPLHVVPTSAPVEAIAKPQQVKGGAAARATSLVLVSGAGAVTAEAAEAPAAEKPPEAAPAETPSAPPPAAEPAPAVAEAPKTGGGGGSGDGPRRPEARRRAVAHRGFNQDDFFGVLFGIAVIAFLLMWFMRGKGDESPEDGTLVAAQSAPVQRIAVAPTPPVPPPLPPADPFGQGPVDLRPQGPVPEAAPAPPPAVDSTPPPAAAAPAISESALPLAERKMHAWFCTASSRLTKASRTELTGELDKFAEIFAGKELVVRGYADTRGSLDYNSALGGNRANVVADFLRTKGLTVVDVQGVGELDGLDDNQNCANQRRVDVWVKGGPAETPSRACAPEPDVESLVCG